MLETLAFYRLKPTLYLGMDLKIILFWRSKARFFDN